jgi:DNA-binding CsgD family transcriptional regulator
MNLHLLTPSEQRILQMLESGINRRQGAAHLKMKYRTFCNLALRAKNKLTFTPRPLSPREREAIHLLAQGKTYKQVAPAMGLAASSAKNFLRSAMQKAGTESLFQLGYFVGFSEGFDRVRELLTAAQAEPCYIKPDLRGKSDADES